LRSRAALSFLGEAARRVSCRQQIRPQRKEDGLAESQGRRNSAPSPAQLVRQVSAWLPGPQAAKRPQNRKIKREENEELT
jgi:hypothetical protein